MGKGIFVTATGTDVGKTYITALMVKKLHCAGYRAGYYKAALSGASGIAESDAGYVKRVSGITQPESSLISYLYKSAVSPHLAAKWEGNPVELAKIIADYRQVSDRYDYITVEGSGGIVCPIRYDNTARIFLADIVKTLGLRALIAANAGLGAINAVTLTAEYMKSRAIEIAGVILNHYTGGPMQDDNIKMIEDITEVPVLACVKPSASELEMTVDAIKALYI